MEKIDISKIRVSYKGNAAIIEHIPTGISATSISASNREINYITAFQILVKRIENHFSLPLRKAC